MNGAVVALLTLLFRDLRAFTGAAGTADICQNKIAVLPGGAPVIVSVGCWMTTFLPVHST